MGEGRNVTNEEDAKIKAVACFGACFHGMRGADRCAKCDGVGSQLAIPGGKRFPNTAEGYWAAALELRKNTEAKP